MPTTLIDPTEFGITLSQGERINLGLGPGERPLKGLGAGYVPATYVFEHDRETFEIDGIEIEMVVAPGESPDTMYLWLADQKVLISGDNYYKSFPNLYPIRGAPYRELATWVESLDQLLEFPVEYLLPGHTRPLIGADHIQEVVTNYREAVNYVLTNTLRGMNRGLTPDELVLEVQLPPHLADKPYLQEFYGTVEWSVRSIFTGYLGWFDGNPTNLFKLSPRDEAERVAKLAGGTEALFTQLQAAVADEDYQWALQLADHLMALDFQDDAVRQLRIEAMTALADEQINATARNYYLSVAQELRAL
ncbi:MAG: alkyl sulfatase dimerization domain-containing protein [Chloroflexota bacterium]